MQNQKPPETNPAKLLCSVGLSAGVDQHIRQLETPLVIPLKNIGIVSGTGPRGTIPAMFHLIHSHCRLFQNFILASSQLDQSETI